MQAKIVIIRLSIGTKKFLRVRLYSSGILLSRRLSYEVVIFPISHPRFFGPLLGFIHRSHVKAEENYHEHRYYGEHTVQIELEHSKIQIISSYAGKTHRRYFGCQQSHQINPLSLIGDMDTRGAPIASVIYASFTLDIFILSVTGRIMTPTSRHP